jgi:hypothetical protein
MPCPYNGRGLRPTAGRLANEPVNASAAGENLASTDPGMRRHLSAAGKARSAVRHAVWR